VAGVGSMFQLFLTNCAVRNYADAKRCDSIMFMEIFHKMLEKGIYLPPSQYETNFLSTAHTPDQVDRTVDAFAESLSEVLE
jgi:glutamate-1-semialdehyde 2,1-aminomutase